MRRSIDPAANTPEDISKLMIGMIVPRPIASVSTVDAEGVRNLAPFSYFTGCSTNPSVVCFCAAVRSGVRPHKGTLRNIEATGEFVVNIVSEDFAEQMNATSAEAPLEIDAFAYAGLTPLSSELVKPPRVAESRIHMERRLREILIVSDKPGRGSLVLGDVLRFHVQEDLLNGFKIDPARLRAIGRMGGPTYCRTQDLFNMRASNSNPLTRSPEGQTARRRSLKLTAAPATAARWCRPRWRTCLPPSPPCLH